MRNIGWLALAAVLLNGVLMAQDASDAPSPYPQFVVFQGNTGYRLDHLGNGISGDSTPANGWTAGAEDDGLEFFNMVKGQTATIKVSVVVTNGNSDLAIWMDFNDNGVWESTERVVWAGKSPNATHGDFQPRVQPPYGGSSTSFNTYTVPIPAGASGSTVKVRALLWDVTSHSSGAMALNGGGHPGGASGYGFTDYGEVEDHEVPYSQDTGAKVQVAEYDGWGTIGNMIAHNGTQNVGSLTSGVQHNLYWLLGNEAAASCFVRFTNAYPNATITHSNAQNCSVSLFTPGNGVTFSPNSLGFATIAMVTPTTTAPFSFTMHMPTNDPQKPTFTWTVQGNGAAPAPLIEIHRPVYTVMPNGSTHSYGNCDAGATFNGGFRIFNNGTAQLNFTGSPMIALSNLNNCTATFAQPTQNYLPGGGWSYQVDVDVTPTTAGSSFGFTITVLNNDPANGTYVVHFTGNAVTSGGGGGGGGGGGTSGTPTLEVSRGSVLASGSSDALGTMQIGGTTTFNYTAANTGTAPLTFTGTPRVAVSGESNCTVTVVQQLPAGLAAGNSAPFIVSVTTLDSGPLSFTLTITSDDPATPAWTLNATASVAGNGGVFDVGSASRGSGGGGCVASTNSLTILAMLIALGALAWRRTSARRREEA